MDRIRVLLVDDHAIVRQGLRLFLDTQADIEIAGEAGDGGEALVKAGELRPDVVVMDITMPDMDGLDAARQIKRLDPGIGVLALTMHDNEEYFFQALNAGASGYIPKRADPMELVSAIRAVYRGGAYFYPSLARSLMAEYLRRVESGEERGSYDGLTPREREVVKLISRGLTNREIARLLHISVKTVDRHRANIMEKLNIHNRVELLKYAIRKGLIEVPK